MIMKRSHTEDVAYFIAFCVEMYKNAHSLTGEEASRIFFNHGVMEYLDGNFEVLHTQSPDWILDEIETVIKDDKQ